MLYKATVRSLGAFSSPLRSDTLFGAFCWSYRYLYGSEALETLLAELKTAPQVIFSNAFPAGTLPLPQGVFDEDLLLPQDAPKEERKKSYQRGKKMKNARFIPVECFLQLAEGNTRGFAAELCDDGISSAMQIHNAVDRDSGTVTNRDGVGNLFTEDAFFATCAEFDIYCYLSPAFSVETFREVLKTALLLGIGGEKSTGKGAFRLTAWQPADIPAPGSATGFMAISDFMPAKTDPTQGRYRIFPKYPRVDREFAATEYPFKKPVLLVEAGSVFFDAEPKPYYGRCVDRISPLYDKITLNAYCIALPMRLK